jgi:hypothetical protein
MLEDTSIIIEQVEFKLQGYRDEDRDYVFMIGYLNALTDYDIIDPRQYDLLCKFAHEICEREGI